MEKKQIWGSLDPYYEDGPVLGRKVANSGFLTTLLQQDPFDEYHFFIKDNNKIEYLRTALEQRFPQHVRNNKIKLLHRRDLIKYVKSVRYHCFHQSDCLTSMAELMQIRTLYSCHMFPITAPTHSLSDSDYGLKFSKLLTPAVKKNDRIIATSQAGRTAAENILSHLRQGYHLRSDQCPSPAVTTIPLGTSLPERPLYNIDTLREELGLSSDRIYFLIFGRISHFSKMDIIPILRAFQRTFQINPELQKKIGLLISGFVTEGDDYPATIAQLAENIGLDCHLVPSPDDELKQKLYSSADVFLSLADNPQETFGLTLLEAGAAGLPTIASDYSGYRDIIEPHTTGILIPTLGANPQMYPETPNTIEELDALAPLLWDNHYYLMLAQRTAVSVPDLAEAIELFCKNEALRKDMGTKARRRIEENFSWTKVIDQHIALWDELQPMADNELKYNDKDHSLQNPQTIPYSTLFQSYTTNVLQPGMMLERTATGDAVYRKKDFPLIYAGMEDLVTPELIHKILFQFRTPKTLQEGLQSMNTIPEEKSSFLILWAIKHDLLTPTQEA
ncbi:MAG: glycosyltransferase family 4 protein [Desulfovibrio sp.]